MKGPWEAETACLGLRPFSADDAEELEAMLRDDEFAQAARERLSENGEARAMAQRWAESADAPWAVVMKDSGQLAGVLGGRREAGEGLFTLEAIYIVRVQSFEQGYAREAARAAAEYAREAIAAARPEGRGPNALRPDAALSLRGSIVKHVHGVNILGFKFSAKGRSS